VDKILANGEALGEAFGAAPSTGTRGELSMSFSALGERVELAGPGDFGFRDSELGLLGNSGHKPRDGARDFLVDKKCAPRGEDPACCASVFRSTLSDPLSLNGPASVFLSKTAFRKLLPSCFSSWPSRMRASNISLRALSTRLRRRKERGFASSSFSPSGAPVFSAESSVCPVLRVAGLPAEAASGLMCSAEFVLNTVSLCSICVNPESPSRARRRGSARGAAAAPSPCASFMEIEKKRSQPSFPNGSAAGGKFAENFEYLIMIIGCNKCT